jgi:hypothetical protein
VVLQTLEKERERRTRSAVEVKTQIQSITADPRPRAGNGSHNPLDSHGGVAGRKRKMVFAVSVIVLLLSLAGMFWVFVGGPGKPILFDSGPGDVAIVTIRNGVGRQLREAGAVYSWLEVSVAVQRDSATPFLVRYGGLENLRGVDGNAVAPNGEFLMEYAGAGKWQGALAGIQFAVQVASRDKTDLPFVADAELLGKWQVVDFVDTQAEFNPQKRRFKGDFLFRAVEFLEGGNSSLPWLTWTKGFIIHMGDQTAARYEIRRVGTHTYLFFEWKSGDVIIAGRKPAYYVLQRNS